ncbi:putative ribonuclease H-like domain-containing protein [Tanacetum coccineum]
MLKLLLKFPLHQLDNARQFTMMHQLTKHPLIKLMKSMEYLSLMRRKMIIFHLKVYRANYHQKKYPRSFTLPCTIGSLDFYAMADLGASINGMPKSMFEHLKLANLKETNMLVEMADMTKKVPLGIIENILVKIDKFLFSLNFVIIDMLKIINETMILGRPFLATIHAEITVFNKEISLGIRDDRIIFDMNKKSYEFTTPMEKAYMVNVVHGKDLTDIEDKHSQQFLVQVWFSLVKVFEHLPNNPTLSSFYKMVAFLSIIDMEICHSSYEEFYLILCLHQYMLHPKDFEEPLK